MNIHLEKLVVSFFNALINRKIKSCYLEHLNLILQNRIVYVII